MRAILISVVLFALAGCNPPHFDLSEPIYLVPEKSFWNGCEDDPAGWLTCHDNRMDSVYNGVNDWFKHFAEPTRPKVIIVYPEENVPDDAVNEPIKLRIGGDRNCDGDWSACYSWTIGHHPAIVFRKAEYIQSSFTAHEFGHAIWRINHVEGRRSIMTNPISFYTAPLDVSEMCAANGTCPLHEDTWCVGTFDDLCRCPSDSPEDGMAKFGAGEIVCR